jgi:transglutaminase-like putative cysteine protease
MSRLRIIHDTVYRYASDVSFGPHRLVLRPREGHDVRLLGMQLTVEPAHELRWSRDLFGNTIGTLSFQAPARRLHIQSDVLIERAVFGIADLSALPLEAYPFSYDPLEQSLAAAYLKLSFPEDAAAVQAWLASTLRIPPEGDALAALQRLNAELFTSSVYRRRDERGVQSPAETLSLGSGSCRDKATLFMEAARALGMAARFASGYLDCAASQAGRASTHAWAEVYLPQSGWIGFDPTIGETTSSKHTVVGVSHHPRGVMPISGQYTGNRSHYLGLEVSVKMQSE